MSGPVDLHVGARVLMAFGPAVVVEVGRHGPTVKDALGENHFIRWDHLSLAGIGEHGVDAIHRSLQPWWDSLSPQARADAIVKLEVVLEILTAHRDGHPLMAREGEPFFPFGEGFGASLTKRIEAMARQLTFEYSVDRVRVRRLLAGEVSKNSVAANTIRGWIKAWKAQGLRGLVDGRKTKGRQGFDVIDPRFVRIADEEFAQFDGTRSKVSLVEIERRILVRLKQEGIDDIDLPQRIIQQYLSTRVAALGVTTRQHKSAALRRNSARANYPATHPGHFAVDVTRADNLVWDDVYERVYSVEIITIISIPSRVVVACRVVPRSANSLEVALALYDAMRPFSMVIEDETSIDDFRWCGIPASLDFGDNPVSAHVSRVRTDRAIIGRHVKPGITPISLRADNGSIFLSRDLRALLLEWGVDLMPSRAGRPLDNTFVERWHDRLQAAYQSFGNGAGFKGRAVHERGRFVGWVGFEPLGSWRELQQHLHRFIAVDYHRNRHGGLKVPGIEDGNFTPLERFDMLHQVTGRVLAPQHPDLIYSLLPAKWLTPGHGGITFRGLTYDGDILDEIRGARPGTYRARDAKVPILFDPRDRSRIWHRSIHDDRIHELIWRDAHLLDAPLTDVIVDAARTLIQNRGGNGVVSRRNVTREIITAISFHATAPTDEEWRGKLIRASMRHDQAILDHAEAQAARELLDPTAGAPTIGRIPRTASPAADFDTPAPDPAPFAIDFDAPFPSYDDEAS